MDPDLILLIISSPSGAGKTTLTRRLLQEFPELRFSVSHTTREPRANEVDGQDYHFVSEEAFRAIIADKGFAEWAEVHGNLYGTCVSEIDIARAAGKIGVLFDVDYQGARQIKEKFPDAIGVFILPPSMAELRRRLDGRGSDDAESRQRRFDKAREEIGHYPFFDYMIVNDELQRALAELRGIVLAEGCRRRRLAARAEALLQE
ncbi:MAG: guanylate kinase [Deltaproteobacteria bacterium]|nr:guanylate kinase [Deltaproteobacteria bacterium]NND27633.1 guanylate kinase [Myxococcales bacterium]MBT8465907.1 guanylate kinase [Deltaproteobacteria bacterium]MBT8481616.1 guanylate kinase [Deltaproteobacteria bacterium]NNK08624.1 guanylate kinase [Myxococcales bacterium]